MSGSSASPSPTRSRSPSSNAPYRYAISHDGTFKGRGLITLEAGADGTTTIVRWDELLIPPVLPHLGALVMTPALGAIFQADLGRLQGARRDGFRAAD